MSLQALAPFQQDPDQRSLNNLSRPYVSIRTGRAVFITSAIEMIFFSWFRGLYRGSLLRRRKSLVRHPVELNRGTPLTLPMDPREQFLAPRTWKRAGQKPDTNRRECPASAPPCILAAARESDPPNHDRLKLERTRYRLPWYGVALDGLPMRPDDGNFLCQSPLPSQNLREKWRWEVFPRLSTECSGIGVD